MRYTRDAVAGLLVAVTVAACGSTPQSSGGVHVEDLNGGHRHGSTHHRQTTHRLGTPARVQLHRTLHGLPLPDRRLTPGEAFHVRARTICVRGYTARVRDVPDSLRREVFAAYRIPYAQHGRYELDHLIPLELGGDNSARNLWPERGRIPNPKDGLENELHNLVCAGSLRLLAAQRAIARDWVTALDHYGSAGYARDRSGPAPSAPSPSRGRHGATARCNDGTYSYAAHHQGACAHHGGVAVFYK